MSSDFIVPDWPASSRVGALVTTRLGGVSAGPWESFNLGGHVGDNADCVVQNRQRLRLSLPAEPVWLNQEHGANVLDAAAPGDDLRADASFACQANVVCAVLTADCLPVLLCDRDARCVAAVHAGWKGMLNGVIETSVRAVRVRTASEIIAWLGPAIGPRAFEVGPEIRQAFSEHHADAVSAFVPGTGDRWLCDIYLLARKRLHRVGVKSIFGAGFCTASESARFFSYRRDKLSGRIASCIWLRAN